MNILHKIMLFVALVFMTSACTKTVKSYKTDTDAVETILKSKDGKRILFLGEKYQYVFSDTSEVSKLNEIIYEAHNAINYSIGYSYDNRMNVSIDKNGNFKIWNLDLEIEPRDSQVLRIVKKGFSKIHSKKSLENGTWRQRYKVSGKITKVNKSLKHKYGYQKLKNKYRLNLTFKDNYTKDVSLDSDNQFFPALLWMIILL